MRKRIRTGRLACMLLLVAAFWALPVPGEQRTYDAAQASRELRCRCVIRFRGTSTLHDFSGTAPAQEFVLAHHSGGSASDGWWSALIRVPVADMSTGLGLRDRTMRKMFHAKEYPYIEARFARIDAARFLDSVSARDDGGTEPNGALAFTLRIAGVAQTLSPIVTKWRRETTRAAFTAGFDLSLEAFGLKRPGFLGAVRVGDRVSVIVEVELATTTNANRH